MSSSYLGIFYCDMCSHGMRQPVWVEGAHRLCAEHFESTTGCKPPPIAQAPPRPDSLPPAEGAWSKIVPGLRARVRPAGLELQGCMNVKLGETVELGNGCGWVLEEHALVELVLLASAYRDSPPALKAQVRLQLIRLLEGKERP